MDRLDGLFMRLKKRGEGALFGFLTAGDPSLESTPRLAEALVEGGVDALEIGMPFSDPIADGPTIQGSSYRALKAGVNPKAVLSLCKELSGSLGVPIILLAYLNTIFRMGYEEFMSRCSSSLINGIVVPDLPVEEAGEYIESARRHGVSTIFMATPTTSRDRLERIIEASEGFLYLVSIKGVTGARKSLANEALSLIKRVTMLASERIPVLVGFGISKPEHVFMALNAGAAGVIVGSAFIDIVSRSLGNQDSMLEGLRSLASSLKRATRGAFT